MARVENFGLAHRQVIGRRPEVVRMAPSKGLPWWIGVWTEGRRFTSQQELALASRGLATVGIEVVTVRREAPSVEVWTPLNEWRPIYEFECPLLGRRADGKMSIIAPDGSTRHIRGDGWAQKPSSQPNRGGSF